MAELSDTLVRDFEIQANEDYSKTWALVDLTTGASLLSATTLMKMDLVLSSGDDDSVKLTMQVRADKLESGIMLADDIEDSGEFDVTFRSETMLELLGEATKISLKYDLLVWDSEDALAFKTNYVKGKISFLKGVTS